MGSTTARQLAAVKRLGVSSEELDRRALVALVRNTLEEGLPILRAIDPHYELVEVGREPVSEYIGTSGDGRFASIRLTAPWPRTPSRDKKDKTVPILVRPRYDTASRHGAAYTARAVASRPEHLLGLQVYREPVWTSCRYDRGVQTDPAYSSMQRSFKRRADGTFNWQRIHELVAAEAQRFTDERAQAESYRKERHDRHKEVAAALRAAGIRFTKDKSKFKLGRDRTGYGDGEVCVKVQGEHVTIAARRFTIPLEDIGTVAKALLNISSPYPRT